MLAPQSDRGSYKLGELPGSSDESKIEVWSRHSDEEGELLELVEYSWGSGMGWYVQKRLTLDASQVDALRMLLGNGITATAPPRPKRLAPPVEQEGNVLRLMFAG